MSDLICVASDRIELCNGHIRKVMSFPAAGGLTTSALVNLESGTELVHKDENEFSFSVDGRVVSSGGVRRDGEEWYCISDTEDGGCEITIKFEVPGAPLKGSVSYRLHKDVGGYVKQLRFVAAGFVRLEKLCVEYFCHVPGSFHECKITYGTDDQEAPITWASEGMTDIMRCHNRRLNEGWVCALGIPGLLRRFMWYPHWNSATASYSMSNSPFVKYLHDGEEFEADRVYTGVYVGDGDGHLLRELMRSVMPKLPVPEGVMYCTWIPFLRDINESLVLRMARQASDMGFSYLVLDDGWFTNENRSVDREKFPHGLEAVSQSVRDLGLRFGLWLSIGTEYGLAATPEKYAARREDGRMKKLDGRTVLCWASGYREYLVEELTNLATKYSVSYFKLDFSAVSSPYLAMATGCHSHEHEHHRGYDDSFIEMYRGLDYLRSELKRRFPDLLIDYSFEAYGTERPNVAALERCELHHVSNFSGLKPEYQDITDIRHWFYRWFGKLPPERILGGLLALQNERVAEYFLTSLAGAPLVAGDLEKLPEASKNRLKAFTSAFKASTRNEILGELAVLEDDGVFDAFVRIGKSGHGYVCAFNTGDEARILSSELPLINVETGTTDKTIGAHDCAMFTF